MANTIPINVDNPDQVLNAGAYGAGAVIRVQSSATEAGTYADVSGTGSTPTVAVTTASSYTGYDPNGATTTWYRTRYENVGATRLSDWSTSFQTGVLTAYATVDDLIELLPQTTGTRNENFLQDCLVRATNLINAKCGRDFFRHPAVSGTETWYIRTSGGDRLWVVDGFASLTLVEWTSSFGGTFTTLAAENTDWYPDDQVLDGSYFSVRLPSSGSLGAWPTGPRLARLTGVRGWATVPTIIESGCLSLARAFAVKSLGGAGSPVGDYDVPTAMLPTETYIAIEWGSHLLRHSRV